jgi:5'-nucleotidase/UDP-sugar diphosphatase
MKQSLLFAAFLCACGSSTSAPRKLVILHTNDEHSHLLGLAPEVDDFPIPTVAGDGTIKGGASRRSVVLQAERAAATAAGASVLLVSAGDNISGSLTQLATPFTAPDYRAMKLLQYDVTTLGNHEFDFGPAGLAAGIKAALASSEGMPAVVASNIHFSGGSGDAALQAYYDAAGTDSTKPIHRSLVVTTSNGIKVGFIGILGADAASVAPLKSPVTFSRGPSNNESNTVEVMQAIYADLQPVVDGLRRQKVDLIVALSHSGLDPANLAGSEDELIAQNVSGIDVIVSGHTHTEAKDTVVNARSGSKVLLQQAGRYGDHVGRIALSVDSKGNVTFDDANTALVPVDSKTVPSDANVNKLITDTIKLIETQPVAAGAPSFLQFTLGEILGAAQPLPAATGGLYFKSVGGLDYVIDNSAAFKETELLDLIADSELAAARAITPSDLSVVAAGAVRVPRLSAGHVNQSGQLSFADVFSAVSLGASPAGTVGYPLCRFSVYMAEVKAAFEVSAGLAYAGHPDFYLVPSGFKFEYDTSRAPFDSGGSGIDPTNGRVTKISQATTDDPDGPSKVVFDASKGVAAWGAAGPLALVKVAANLYVASFAAVAGVHLKDDSGNPIPNNNPAATILHRGDTTEIKDWEALGAYVHAQAGAGVLPHRYLATDASGVIPRRAICSGPACK